MTGRRRGRRLAGLAVIILLVTVVAGVAAIDGGARWLVVRDEAGGELARARLPPSDEFALRYRNSVYESMAEERFRVTDGHLSLVAVSADELAVLEEYYTAIGAVRDAPDGMRWTVPVERRPIELPLRVQATALGQRTLLAAGEEIALWRLVAGRDDTSVTLSVEDSG